MNFGGGSECHQDKCGAFDAEGPTRLGAKDASKEDTDATELDARNAAKYLAEEAIDRGTVDVVAADDAENGASNAAKNGADVAVGTDKDSIE